MEPPAKKPRKFLEDDSSSESGDDSGGVSLNNKSADNGFKINEEYARRFEHNKKREELQKLESKFGKGDEEEEESSSEEDEDEDGELATEALDAEIMATLKAIRSKDPRLYDSSVSFYTQAEENAEGTPANADKQQKPMTLKDYHRENLLSGTHFADEDTAEAPKTYVQEQEDLKKDIVREMHAAGEDDDDSSADEEEGFLKRKSVQEPAPEPKAEVKLNIENADKDPETFLSNFLSARAWIPTERTLQPFESDDEEEDKRAEAWEEAYNFRFEDPSKMNTALITHARDATNQQSVRRDDMNSRKKLREAERQRKEEEKKQRETEKNRLRKLKMEELQEKVQQIKEVAGLRGAELTDEDWAKFLDDAWDDDKFEKEMQKRFGDEYYNQGVSNDPKKHPKKPTWDDDIDIKDLIPDFEDDEEERAVDGADVEMEDANDSASEGANKKSKAEQRRDQKREARKDRLRIEEALDRNLDLEVTLLPGATKKTTGGFRYRETSPTSFGLTPRDILMADDTQLNEYAGLKKLAAFRDPEKKRRDQKKLGKKARLRQWRQDTFGNAEGPEFVFGGDKPVAQKEDITEGGEVDIREGDGRKKKRKRSKKH